MFPANAHSLICGHLSLPPAGMIALGQSSASVLAGLVLVLHCVISSTFSSFSAFVFASASADGACLCGIVPVPCAADFQYCLLLIAWWASPGRAHAEFDCLFLVCWGMVAPSLFLCSCFEFACSGPVKACVGMVVPSTLLLSQQCSKSFATTCYY